MTYQHVAALVSREDDELVVFLPPGSVVSTQRFGLGYRLLVEDALPSIFNVASLDKPATLHRLRRSGSEYSVKEKMKLGLAPSAR